MGSRQESIMYNNNNNVPLVFKLCSESWENNGRASHINRETQQVNAYAH